MAQFPFCISLIQSLALSLSLRLFVSLVAHSSALTLTHSLRLIPIVQCLYATQFKSIVSVFVPFLGGIPFKPCIEKQIGILYAFASSYSLHIHILFPPPPPPALRILQSHRFCILKCSRSQYLAHVMANAVSLPHLNRLYIHLSPFSTSHTSLPLLATQFECGKIQMIRFDFNVFYDIIICVEIISSFLAIS